MENNKIFKIYKKNYKYINSKVSKNYIYSKKYIKVLKIFKILEYYEKCQNLKEYFCNN